MSDQTCGFIPPTPGYAPCTREQGHDGPCAHPRLGATGQFPDGKYNEDDEGELQLAVAANVQDQTVVIMFGKNVSWLALKAHEARQWAGVLMQKADEAEAAAV